MVRLHLYARWPAQPGLQVRRPVCSGASSRLFWRPKGSVKSLVDAKTRGARSSRSGAHCRARRGHVRHQARFAPAPNAAGPRHVERHHQRELYDPSLRGALCYGCDGSRGTSISILRMAEQISGVPAPDPRISAPLRHDAQSHHRTRQRPRHAPSCNDAIRAVAAMIAITATSKIRAATCGPRAASLTEAVVFRERYTRSS